MKYLYPKEPLQVLYSVYFLIDRHIPFRPIYGSTLDQTFFLKDRNDLERCHRPLKMIKKKKKYSKDNVVHIRCTLVCVIDPL